MIHSAYMSDRNAYILRAYCYGLGSNDSVSCDCERREEPSLPRRDLSMQLNTHHSTTLVEKEGRSPSPAPQET